MLEKFSEEELKTLIDELKGAGYEVKTTTKSLIFMDEARKVLGGNPFVCQTVKQSIYSLADFITNNYEKKEPASGMGISRTFTRKNIPPEIEQEYRRIINGILQVIKPGYGMLGFDERGHIRDGYEDV